MTKIDTRRMSDPAYVADLMDKRANMPPTARMTVERAAVNLLRQVADQSDRDHVTAVIERGIDDRHDADATLRGYAEGAWDALVAEGLIIGPQEGAA